MSEKFEVYKSIVAVTRDLAKEGISKDKTNQQQGFKYRGIDQVYSALSPLLAEHNLCVLPRVVSREASERTSAKGGVLFYTAVTVEFDLVSAVDGSRHTVTAVGEAFDSGDKSIGKAQSYAYKAMAFMLFAIPVEGQDNDPDAHSHEVKPKGQTATAKTSSEPLPEWSQKLYSELAAHCIGDTVKMEELLHKLSYYKSGDKEYFLELAKLPKASEKWANKVLGALRKYISEQTDNIADMCATCGSTSGHTADCPEDASNQIPL